MSREEEIINDINNGIIGNNVQELQEIAMNNFKKYGCIEMG